jgi:hypothetical protein
MGDAGVVSKIVMSTNSHPIESHDSDASDGPARLDRRKFIAASGRSSALGSLFSGTSAAPADASVGAGIELIRPDQINQPSSAL